MALKVYNLRLHELAADSVMGKHRHCRQIAVNNLVELIYLRNIKFYCSAKVLNQNLSQYTALVRTDVHSNMY